MNSVNFSAWDVNSTTAEDEHEIAAATLHSMLAHERARLTRCTRRHAAADRVTPGIHRVEMLLSSVLTRLSCSVRHWALQQSNALLVDRQHCGERASACGNSALQRQVYGPALTPCALFDLKDFPQCNSGGGPPRLKQKLKKSNEIKHFFKLK